MVSSRDVGEALLVTSEVMGFSLPPLALKPMVRELRDYEPSAVLKALRRCQRELTGRLTLKAILDRIENADGRPGAEQAWAMCPRDEATTVVWTDEMGEAFGMASLILETGDKVAARMAFKESYERLVREARERKDPAIWRVSLGTRVEGRATPIMEAAKLGRISAKSAAALVDGLPDGERAHAQLTGGTQSIALLAKNVYDEASTGTSGGNDGP